MICDSFPIAAREELCDGVFDYRIRCPELCETAAPGQFAEIGVPGFSLRRPISFCGIDRARGEARFVFSVRGAGTRALSALRAGGVMDLLGPLGRGFDVLDPPARAAVVGGGVGVAPLLALAGHYASGCSAVLGFRTREQVLLDTDFAARCETVVCTEDGSLGVRGTVAPALEPLLQARRLDIVYACGSRPMLQCVRELAMRYGVRCQLSLEERMACGVGACVGCAVLIERGGERRVRRVCKDGPVFEASEVVF